MDWPVRKETKEKARAFDEITQMPGFFILITNTRFELIYANDFFYSYFDIRPEDLLGKALYGFFNDDIKPVFDAKHIARVVNEKNVWGYEAVTAKSDGEPVQITWNQTYLTDRKEAVILSLGLIREKYRSGDSEQDAECRKRSNIRQATNIMKK